MLVLARCRFYGIANIISYLESPLPERSSERNGTLQISEMLSENLSAIQKAWNVDGNPLASPAQFHIAPNHASHKMKVFFLTAIAALTCVNAQIAEIDLALAPANVVLSGVHVPGSIPYNAYEPLEVSEAIMNFQTRKTFADSATSTAWPMLDQLG